MEIDLEWVKKIGYDIKHQQNGAPFSSQITFLMMKNISPQIIAPYPEPVISF